jgi:hypothetical protein
MLDPFSKEAELMAEILHSDNAGTARETLQDFFKFENTEVPGRKTPPGIKFHKVKAAKK